MLMTMLQVLYLIALVLPHVSQAARRPYVDTMGLERNPPSVDSKTGYAIPFGLPSRRNEPDGPAHKYPGEPPEHPNAGRRLPPYPPPGWLRAHRQKGKLPPGHTRVALPPQTFKRRPMTLKIPREIPPLFHPPLFDNDCMSFTTEDGRIMGGSIHQRERKCTGPETYRQWCWSEHDDVNPQQYWDLTGFRCFPGTWCMHVEFGTEKPIYQLKAPPGVRTDVRCVKLDMEFFSLILSEEPDRDKEKGSGGENAKSKPSPSTNGFQNAAVFKPVFAPPGAGGVGGQVWVLGDTSASPFEIAFGAGFNGTIEGLADYLDFEVQQQMLGTQHYYSFTCAIPANASNWVFNAAVKMKERTQKTTLKALAGFSFM